MLNERKEFGMISLLADGQIQIRTDTVIERDGVEVSRIYFREVLDPATLTDPSKYDTRIQQMISIFWTPEVIKKRKAFLKAEVDKLRADTKANTRIMNNG